MILLTQTSCTSRLSCFKLRRECELLLTLAKACIFYLLRIYSVNNTQPYLLQRENEAIARYNKRTTISILSAAILANGLSK